MNDFTLTVKQVYDFVPKNDIEKKAFIEMITPMLYHPIMIFKSNDKPEEEAAAFIQSFFDKAEALSLLISGEDYESGN